MKSLRIGTALARMLGRALRGPDAGLRELAAGQVLRWLGKRRPRYRDRKADRGVPPCSTRALPGSEVKIEVMRQRVAAGYSPHHPDDARLDGLGDGEGALVAWWRKNALPRVLGVESLQGQTAIRDSR